MSVSQSDQRPPPPVYRLLAAGSLLVPLIAALVFVQLFAGPLPLTDEWTYTHALREMHDIGRVTQTGPPKQLVWMG